MLKHTIRYLGLGNLARESRRLAYRIFDFLGSKTFVLLRACHLLAGTKQFDKEVVIKLLMVRLDRIGDVILSTPAIRAVRGTFPRAEIHMLVSEYTRDLVIENPNIDRVVIYKKDKLDKEYDLAIALHPGFRQNHLTFMSRAKFRVGYTGWGGGFFLTHALEDDRATRMRHEVESALEVVGAVGCVTNDKRLEVSVTEEGERCAEDFFNENNLTSDDLIVAIHPGARQKYIRWRKEGFAEVSNRLIKEENARVILIGDKEEEELVGEILSLIAGRPLFAVGLKLTRLVSLIKRCSLFIGNSTGPMHIAAALGVPVVAIFGPIHPLDSHKEWGPWGEGHIVVSRDLNCHGCHPTDCKTFDCMRLITANQVFEAAKKLVGKYEEKH